MEVKSGYRASSTFYQARTDRAARKHRMTGEIGRRGVGTIQPYRSPLPVLLDSAAGNRVAVGVRRSDEPGVRYGRLERIEEDAAQGYPERPENDSSRQHRERIPPSLGRLEAVGYVDHPVGDVLGTPTRLLHRLPGIGKCADDSDSEVRIHCPVSVRVDLERNVVGNDSLAG